MAIENPINPTIFVWIFGPGLLKPDLLRAEPHWGKGQIRHSLAEGRKEEPPPEYQHIHPYAMLALHLPAIPQPQWLNWGLSPKPPLRHKGVEQIPRHWQQCKNGLQREVLGEDSEATIGRHRVWFLALNSEDPYIPIETRHGRRISKRPNFVLLMANDRHHRFAKRRPIYPTLMLPAEANPRAWHGWLD